MNVRDAFDYLLRFPWVEPLGRTLLHFLWQGALVGAAAGLLLRLTRRRSPALRHAVAASGLACCALLPVLTFLTLARPGRPVATAAVPPPAVQSPRVLVNAPPPVSAVPLPTPAPVVAMRDRPPRSPNGSPPIAPAVTFLAGWETSAARTAVPLWLAGVFLLGTRLAVGWGRVQRWRGGALPVAGAEVMNRCRELAARLGIAPGGVRLLVSRVAALPGPVALGVFRPVVLLPAWVLERLPLAQIEALLAHELAHVRRHDYLWNLLASALEVALFYHPAVWLLGQELRTAREECCDELAATVCPDRVTYARALAAVAEPGSPAAPFALPAPAAARGPLVTRVRRLLGLDVPPEPLFSARHAAWVLALATAGLAALGILHSGRLLAQPDMEENDPDVPVLVHPAPRGRVVDPAGRPVAGARVLLLRTVSSYDPRNGVIETVTADAAGRFAFARPVRFRHPAAVRDTAEFTLFAVAPGRAPAWAALWPETPEDPALTLTLTTPKPRTFEVVDRAGHPVGDATVWLRFANAPGTPAGRPRAADSFQVTGDFGICAARTGADGRATLDTLPDAEISVAASKSGFEDETGGVTPPDGVRQFTLRPAATLEGRVTDPLGRPVAGATVSLYPKFNYYHFFEARTDAQGRYRVERIWSDREAHPDQPDWGKYAVAVRHPRFTAATREVAFDPGQTITGFDLAAVPGTELVGHLLDPETKAPVVSGSVQVDSPSGRQTFRTDVNGAFHGRVMPGKISAFFHLTPRRSYVDADGSRSGLPSNLRLEARGEQVVLDLYLPGPLGHAGTLRGQVRTAEGKPAPGCHVGAVVDAGHLYIGAWGGNQLRNVTTDAEGRFLLPEVPIGPTFTLTARAAEGDATGTLTGRLEGDALDLTDPLVLLQPTVAGGEFLLTDLDGKPWSNQVVNVTPIVAGEESGVRGLGQQLKTDADGVLRVTRVVPATRHVVAIPNGYADLQANVFDSPAAGAPAPPRRTLVLDQQALVRLLGADGQPLPIKDIRHYEALTTLHGGPTRWSNVVPVIARVGTDSVVTRGKMVGHRGDTARLLLETDDGTLVRAEGPLPEDGSNLLVLHATEVLPADTAPDPDVADVNADDLVGRVVNPDGEPLAGASVSEFPRAQRSEEEKPVMTGPDGVFRLPGAGRRWVNFVAVAKEGWATTFLTDAPVGRGFRVTLHNDTHLRGTVGGEPSGPVSFTLSKNKFTARGEGFASHEVRDLPLRFTTDARGGYDVPVEPGRWRWKASDGDGRFANGEIQVEAGRTVDLGATLRRGHDVALELVDCQNGRPVPGIEVCIYERNGPGSYRNREGSTRISDAEGCLRWENLPPGETVFEAPRRRRGGQPGAGLDQQPYARWWRQDEPVDWRRVDYARQPPTGDRGTEWLVVDVRAEMPPVRVLMERGVKVAGRVLRPDGTGAAGLSVQAIAQAGGAMGNFDAQTDAQGNFLAYLPAGNGVAYTLNAHVWPDRESPGANAVSERFTSKAGDEFSFELKMPKGSWLTGRLVTSEAVPAAGFRVTAEAADGLDGAYASRIATAGADGRFRLGPLRPGNYRVRPGVGAGAPLGRLEGAKNADAEITTEGETRDLGDLPLPAGAKLME